MAGPEEDQSWPQTHMFYVAGGNGKRKIHKPISCSRMPRDSRTALFFLLIYSPFPENLFGMNEEEKTFWIGLCPRHLSSNFNTIGAVTGLSLGLSVLCFQ